MRPTVIALVLLAACGDNLEGEGPEVGGGDELCLPPAGRQTIPPHQPQNVP